MKLVVLGSGGSWPCRDRAPPAIALKLNGEILLFDCAEGTQRQFMFSPVSFMQVRHIFLSHLHGDHFLGLPGLVETMGLNGRKDQLDVYGPPGTAERLRKLFTVGYFLASFPLKFHDLQNGDKVDIGGYTVRCADAAHMVPALAYSVEEAGRPGRFNLEKAKSLGIPEGRLYNRLQAGETVTHAGKTFTPDMVLGPPRKGRKIVYTGDSAPSEAILELSKGADVLMHDSTSDAALVAKANQYGHSSNVQAAETARAANVQTLLLVHISPRFGKDDEPRILAEAKAVFPGTVLASDLLELDVKLRD